MKNVLVLSNHPRFLARFLGGLTVAVIRCTSAFGRLTIPRMAVFSRSKPGLVSKESLGTVGPAGMLLPFYLNPNQWDRSVTQQTAYSPPIDWY